jgi:hypothetical protein
MSVGYGMITIGFDMANWKIAWSGHILAYKITCIGVNVAAVGGVSYFLIQAFKRAKQID